MAIDWGLAQNSGDPLDALRYFGQGQQDAAARQQLAQQQAQRQRQLAARPQIAQQIQGGDYAGARQSAVLAGDTDYATAISGLSEDHRKQLADQTDFLGRMANGILQLPEDQWQAAYQQAIPEAKAHGFHDAEIAAFTPTRQNLIMAVQSATILKDAIDAQNKANEPYTLGQGQSRFVGDKQIASVAPKPEYITTPAGGVSTLVSGGGGSAPTTLTPPTAAPASPEVVGRRVNGYTPRIRDGGDNSDAVVDRKVANLADGVGVDPDTPLTRPQLAKLALAIPYTEGGAGSLADRNNNPGNIQNGPFAKKQPGYAGVGEGGYAKFVDKASGQAAVGALLNRYYARGQTTIRDIIEGRPTAAQAQRSAVPMQASGGPPTIIKGPPATAPTGFRWTKNNTALEAIPGGPADKQLLDPSTVRFMAEQYVLGGDKSVIAGLGRGRQGAENIQAVRTEIVKVAREQGMTGRDVAAQLADFSGSMAAERSAGTRMAQVDLAVTEAQRIIPIARQASANLWRSGFVPLDRVRQAVQNGTNNVDYRRAYAANNAIVNVYARAISPTGVPTVSDKDHAWEMLNTAQDQESYNAVLDVMQQEMAAARAAPRDVRRDINASVGGALGGRAPVRVNSPAEAARLPKGTPIVLPDGRTGITR